jgi:hypothetical protein
VVSELDRLESFYLEIRADVAAGRRTFEEAKAALEQEIVRDPAGNLWRVDISSPPDSAQFSVRLPDGRVVSGTRADWGRGGTAAPAAAPYVQTPQAPAPVSALYDPVDDLLPAGGGVPDFYGPAGPGPSFEQNQTAPAVFPHVLGPSVNSDSEEEGRGDALNARVQELVQRVPGGKVTVIVVLFLLIVAVLRLAGYGAGGDDTGIPDVPVTTESPTRGGDTEASSDGKIDDNEWVTTTEVFPDVTATVGLNKAQGFADAGCREAESADDAAALWTAVAGSFDGLKRADKRAFGTVENYVLFVQQVTGQTCAAALPLA